MAHRLVVHCQRAPYDVYIGRGADPNSGRKPERAWGNPFQLGKHGDRASVIAQFREYVWKHPYWIDYARDELRGKVLGCWCTPEACHGDVLVEMANTEPVPHEQFPCGCSGEGTCPRCLGVYVCKHCRGAEGALTSECPRVKVSADELDKVYCGQRNFIVGTWVEGCYSEGGEQVMPGWAGRVHCLV